MIEIDGSSLSVKQIASVSAGADKVELSKSARLNVQKSRKNLEKHIADGKTIYGINTGFGALMNVKIEKKDLLKLQENLIRSHSAGVGDPLDERYVRAMMIVRANSLSKGYSDVPLMKATPSFSRKVCFFIPARFNASMDFIFLPSK